MPPLSSDGGLTFRAGFHALPGTTVDYGIDYTVTASAAHLINDAVLSAAMGNNGATGTVSVIELFTFPGGSAESMEVSLPGNPSASLSFTGVPSILVQKDIFINGAAWAPM